jgi:hypothetical protein
MTGNALVDAISEIAFEGNIIPNSWFKALQWPDGKPDLIAIMILSEIVYWYRAKEDSDEATGEKVRRKRFKAELLQRSYNSFAEQFGLSYCQVRDACHRLQERYGVIRLVVRERVETETGLYGNVLYIAPVPENIRSITHPQAWSHVSREKIEQTGQAPPVQRGRLPRSNGEAPPVQRGTYTETTTQITTETEEGESAPARAQDMGMCVQDTPIKPAHPRSQRMPADYTPSAELRAELEGRYPDLDFEEELYAIRAWEFATPKSDWDATTRLWFHRSATRRKEAAPGPGQGTGGDWRNTATTDKRTRELERQKQVALANFHAAQAQHQAITVSDYEDITHGAQRLPGFSGLVDPPGGVLPSHASPGQSRPAVLCRPSAL